MLRSTMSTESSPEVFIEDADMEVDVGRSEATIRYTIRNFSKLANNTAPILSPKFYVKHVPWRVRADMRSNCLELSFLCDLPKDHTSWLCMYNGGYCRVIPTITTDVPPLIYRFFNPRENYLNCQTSEIRFGSFTEFVLMMNPQNGYIKDDAITLEMYISIERTVNVPYTNTKQDGRKEANDLVQAITLGDIEKCVALVEKDEYHNMEDISGRTPLMWAAFKGNLRIVQILVEANCKIDIADHFGFTPLMRAVQFGHMGVAKYLLDKGADVNYFAVTNCLRCNTLLKCTALHFSVEHFKDINEMSKFLISRGTDLSSIKQENAVRLVTNGARSQVDSSTIIWAIKYEIELVKILLQTEEYINGTDVDGCSPLMHAVLSKNLETVKLLVEKGANPCKRDKRGQTPFSQSVLGSDIAIVKYLIEHGARRLIHTALCTAVEKGNISFVQVLLDNKANINLVSESGDTPLTKSIKLNNFALIKLLIEHGASVNFKDGNGSTPLLQCIRIGDLNTLKFLVENGANVNMSDQNGTTPFMECLKREKSVFLEFLIASGANVNFSDEEKEKIVSIVIETDNSVFLMDLIDRGVDFSSCQQLLNKMAEDNFDFAIYLRKIEKSKDPGKEGYNEEAAPQK